jgi:hypothetical protein
MRSALKRWLATGKSVVRDRLRWPALRRPSQDEGLLELRVALSATGEQEKGASAIGPATLAAPRHLTQR